MWVVVMVVVVGNFGVFIVVVINGDVLVKLDKWNVLFSVFFSWKLVVVGFIKVIVR